MEKAKNIFILVLILSLAGLALASYQLKMHYVPDSYVCGSTSACSTVATSTYSEIFGIPLAFVGIAGFALLAGISALGISGKASTTTLFRAIFALSATGLAFASYCIYLEIFKIHAVCSLCTCSHALGFVIFVLSLLGLIISTKNGKI